jgi:hypothetical protein
MESPARAGIGFGCALAITISWSVNHSIWWAVLHGIFGWIYVIYFELGVVASTK